MIVIKGEARPCNFAIALVVINEEDIVTARSARPCVDEILHHPATFYAFAEQPDGLSRSKSASVGERFFYRRGEILDRGCHVGDFVGSHISSIRQPIELRCVFDEQLTEINWISNPARIIRWYAKVTNFIGNFATKSNDLLLAV